MADIPPARRCRPSNFGKGSSANCPSFSTVWTSWSRPSSRNCCACAITTRLPMRWPIWGGRTRSATRLPDFSGTLYSADVACGGGAVVGGVVKTVRHAGLKEGQRGCCHFVRKDAPPMALLLCATPCSVLDQEMEARVGIEPTHRGFADLGLTTWLPRRICERAVTTRGTLGVRKQNDGGFLRLRATSWRALPGTGARKRTHPDLSGIVMVAAIQVSVVAMAVNGGRGGCAPDSETARRTFGHCAMSPESLRGAAPRAPPARVLVRQRRPRGYQPSACRKSGSSSSAIVWWSAPVGCPSPGTPGNRLNGASRTWGSPTSATICSR